VGIERILGVVVDKGRDFFNSLLDVFKQTAMCSMTGGAQPQFIVRFTRAFLA